MSVTLPTEYGLYQRLSGPPIEHEITYRYSFAGGWMNALDNEPLTMERISMLARAYEAGDLVRLVRVPVKVSLLDQAAQLANDLAALRIVQGEIAAQYHPLDPAGMDNPLWAAAQERIEALQAELRGLL